MTTTWPVTRVIEGPTAVAVLTAAPALGLEPAVDPIVAWTVRLKGSNPGTPTVEVVIGDRPKSRSIVMAVAITDPGMAADLTEIELPVSFARRVTAVTRLNVELSHVQWMAREMARAAAFAHLPIHDGWWEDTPNRVLWVRTAEHLAFMARWHADGCKVTTKLA